MGEEEKNDSMSNAEKILANIHHQAELRRQKRKETFEGEEE